VNRMAASLDRLNRRIKCICSNGFASVFHHIAYQYAKRGSSEACAGGKAGGREACMRWPRKQGCRLAGRCCSCGGRLKSRGFCQTFVQTTVEHLGQCKSELLLQLDFCLLIIYFIEIHVLNL
jgi:hypothetical protein